MKYPRIFSPIKLGKLELPNRLVFSPVSTHLYEKGVVTDRYCDFFAEIARGGAGMIIAGDAIVQAPLGMRSPDDLLISDDSFIPGMRRCAEAIKGEGARAALNISHGGCMTGKMRKGQFLACGGEVPVGPSVRQVPFPGLVMPRALTIEEIKEIEDAFAEAARRAKEAGFDVVSLHGTHWFLINQFLSPFFNRRQDEYGGDFDRRLHFLLEIIRKTKQKIGDDFPMMCTLSGEEISIENGLTIEDTREIARRLEAAGIHGLRISLGTSPIAYSFDVEYLPPHPAANMRSPHGNLVYLAAAVKHAVSIPVMTQGRIIEPELAEQILEQGKADLIGLARGLMADPEWGNKAKEGRDNEIRHCISCKYCSKGTAGHPPMACAINPRLGREGEAKMKITPALKPRTVFIAGGGPAGLETARVAALRGHKVVLYEKDKLGGQLNLACIPPGKADIRLVLDFELAYMSKLGVEIRNEELTAETVRREKPDAVVVATGATPDRPDIPGIDNANVIGAWEILGGYMPKGRVVVLGGKQIGAETAEYLATKGYQVTVVEQSDDIDGDVPFSITWKDLQKYSFKTLGVKVLTNTTVEEITERGVKVNGKGQNQFLEAETVVLALGNKPDHRLAGQLENLGIEIHAVGDCTGVGRLVKAIYNGYNTGLAL
jgi:2,4-dienoyl-CoA reductase-like NADH-dependent reductase (Old Yellow Enzyme family)/thioredoxin reductase